MRTCGPPRFRVMARNGDCVLHIVSGNIQEMETLRRPRVLGRKMLRANGLEDERQANRMHESGHELAIAPNPLRVYCTETTTSTDSLFFLFSSHLS